MMRTDNKWPIEAADRWGIVMTGSLMLGARRAASNVNCFNREIYPGPMPLWHFRKLDDGKAVESHVAGACG